MNQDAELIAVCDAATACVDAYNAAVEADADEAALSELFRHERGAFAQASKIPARTLAGLIAKAALCERWEGTRDSIPLVLSIARDAASIVEAECGFAA
jgi:hypothetical protein